MESKKLAQLCRELADNKKAENIVLLDVHEVSSVTDYFVVATGTSEPHLRAITGEIVDKLREAHGIAPHAIDGGQQAGWVVLDYIDVIVHVMRPEVRQQYDLEGLWNDAPRVRPARKRKPKATAGAVAETPAEA
jgi:ribosome-associated protein